MTGGASSFVMSFNHCWIVLSILAVLLLTSDADSQDCFLQITVRRHTVYEASVGQELKINCTVALCNSSPPTVTWKKIEGKMVLVNMSTNIKIEWKMLEEFEGVSYLIFPNILKSDSGLYQCQTEGTVSHSINVSVYDGVVNGTIQKNVTANSTPASDQEPESIMQYVYSAAGILSFVIVVIIVSVVSLRGCKGKSNKEAETENQYITIPMAEHPSLHTSPRGSPAVPPCRRSSQRQTPLRQPDEVRLSRGSEQGGGRMEEDRGRQRTTAEEEGNSIVYAALNHQQRAAARPRRVVEENSEYAAIRVA